RPNKGVFRLPVDRVFSMPGYGTVVTGTIISGAVKMGDNIETMPLGLKSKVRNIHIHGEKRDQAIAGQRVALNISSLETGQVTRGAVISSPGALAASYRLDVSLYLLETAKELKNRSRVRIYLGTSEIFGRVRLLDREELKPGQTAYVQLELENQALALRGDRFVIRSYSPMRTIGGGSVISSEAIKYRRYREDVLESFEIKEEGNPEKLIVHLLEDNSAILDFQTISKKTGIEEEKTGVIIQALEQLGKIIKLEGEGLEGYLAKETYNRWIPVIITALEGYHIKYPLRDGYPKEELRSRHFEFLNSRQFQLILKLLMEDGIISLGEKSIAKSDFVPGQVPGLENKLAIIENSYLKGNMQPPIWQEAFKNSGFDQGMSEEVLHYLIKMNILIKIAPDLYFHSSILKTTRERLLSFFEQNKEITVAQFRDIFATSRKYALPLLEYFDQIRITRREGDVRLLETRQKK
ncbi:MAG: selenocysteine-specific translation factor, partial [Peptococcaceae bacterium]|nr:selenocysteine-specific translation factor [Peptococcaceae bacterium]